MNVESAEREVVEEDALVQVYLRNEFYKKKFFLALGVYFLSLIVIVVLIGMLTYLVKHPTSEPLYFVADDMGRFIQDVPVESPNMSVDDVANWVVEAVETSYTYNFMNYPAQLQNAQKYFTDFGWLKYMDGLRLSNNLLAVKDRKMILIAKVVDKPKLLNQGGLSGKYGYRFEMPVLVTNMLPPYDDKSRFQNALIVTVIVQRQNLLQSYKGLGILQMIGRVATTAPPQNLNQTNA
jgi:intracellular multiplication protein IcmL